MKIGTLADRLGIPASTIRYYERVGLIDPPPRVSGIRRFNNSAITTLRFIQLAQAAGFTLSEIKTLQSNSAGNASPTGMWTAFAQAKHADVRRQITDLERMEQILTSLMRCDCPTLSACVELSDKALSASSTRSSSSGG